MDINDVGRLLVSVTRKVKKTASQIVHPLTQLEKWLKEATSNTNWGCSSTILNEIARSMTDYHDYIIIQRYICDCLNEKPSKWRKIYKTLILIEYLLKHGIERFVDDIKENMYKIRHLKDFYYSEEGKDKGTGIREKSKFIVNLLNDPFLLKTERKKARDNRGKYIGINGKAGMITSISDNIRTSNNTYEDNNLYRDRFPANSQRSNYNNSYSNTNYDLNREKELYDPYKPNFTGFSDIYNSTINKRPDTEIIKDEIFDDDLNSSSKVLATKTCQSQTDFLNENKKISIPVLPPPLSSSNKNKINKKIISSKRLVNNNDLNGNTEIDKSISEAAQRLAKQEISNPFFDETKNEITSSPPSLPSVSNSIEDAKLSLDWGTFTAANDQEENHQKFSQKKNSTNPFDSSSTTKSDIDLDKKKKIDSMNLIDLLANVDISDINEDNCKQNHKTINDFLSQENDIFQISTDNDNRRYNVHIPNGF